MEYTFNDIVPMVAHHQLIIHRLEFAYQFGTKDGWRAHTRALIDYHRQKLVQWTNALNGARPTQVFERDLDI